jgi:hypothetical protein
MNKYKWTKEEAQIIKGSWANDGGRLALTIVVERLGNLQGGSMAADTHMTAFNEGRRWVAQQLATAINMPLDQLVEKDIERKTGTVTATERANAVKRGNKRAPRRKPTADKP